jgi:hypothetical protein
VKQLFEQLTTPEVMAEVLALLMAGLLSMALAQYLKRWLKPLAARLTGDRWQLRFVVAGMVLAPSLIAVVLVLALRVIFASFSLPVSVIDRALDLVTVFVLVRTAVHVLSVSLGPNSWIRSWEMRITVTIWFVISFQLLGWFDAGFARVFSKQPIERFARVAPCTEEPFGRSIRRDCLELAAFTDES